MIPDFSSGLTWKQALEPAIDIATQGDTDEAANYLWAYIEHLLNNNSSLTYLDAKEQALRNIGYYAGYYDTKARTAVATVFGAIHPIFGEKEPTPQEGLAAGEKLMYDYLTTPKSLDGHDE